MAEIIVSSGQSRSGTILNSEDIMHLFSGGTANYTTVNAGGALCVYNGGFANITTVNSFGALIVSNYGNAYSATVNTGAWVTVFSGGSLKEVEENGGYVSVETGAFVRYKSNTFSGLVLGKENAASLHSGTTAVDIKVSEGGIIEVFYSGLASGVILNSSGYMHVSWGGVANNTTVKGGGLYLNGGTASTTVVSSGGFLSVENGGVANSNTIFYGNMLVSSGGTANFTTVSSGGKQHVFEKGSAFRTTVSDDGIQYISEGGYASMTQVNSDGECKVCSGGVLDGGQIYSDGSMTVSGGEIRDISVFSGGRLYILRGGIVNSATLFGDLNGSSGGTMGGALRVSVGGVANSVNVQSGGRLYVYSGGTLNKTAVTSGGTMCVSSGGVQNEVRVLSDGSVTVSSGGKLTGKLTLSSGAVVTVSSGGIVDFDLMQTSAGASALVSNLSVIKGSPKYTLTVGSGSEMPRPGTYSLAAGAAEFTKTITVTDSFGVKLGTLTAGGAAFNDRGLDYTLALNGAELSVTVAESTLFTGDLTWEKRIDAGSSAFNVNIVDPGRLYVLSGGTANQVRVNPGGRFIVSKGAEASDLSIGFGGLLTVNGGAVSRVSIVSTGSMSVINDAAASGVRVLEGGIMTVSNGGKLTGTLELNNGADVTVTKGGIVEFDLAQTSAGAANSLVNGLSLVKGAPVYTLTVNGSEPDGTYYLATGAEGFDQTITVNNTSGTKLGTLSLGETNMIDGTSYTLDLSESSNLTVTITGNTPPEGRGFFEGDFDGDGRGMLAVQQDGDVTVFMNGEPWGLGLTLDDGWNVVGTGDFDGDGMDDFLRVSEEGYVVGEMSNGNGSFTPQVLNFLNSGWDILGTGDFNGNGTDDVLIANPTGASESVGLLGYWESGVTWTLINGYSAEWKCVSTGDFDGDGKCDMLWRNRFVGDGGLTYNAYCTWIVENEADWRMVSVANPDEWNFLCSGDFDGNGSHDIAMINDVGVVGIWGVADGYLNSWSILSAVTNEWKLAGVADFNGDGTDDISWSNTETGLTGYWQINDKTLTTWANIATIGS